MSNKIAYAIEIDQDLIKECEKLSKELGLDFSTAINIFARKFYRFDGFPFRIEGDQFNKYSFKTMIESEREQTDPDRKLYDNFSDFLPEKFPDFINDTGIQS